MNRLCPVCEKPLVDIWAFPKCESCNLKMDPTFSDGIYEDEYLLHYELYEQTDFSKILMKERLQFIENTMELLSGKSLLDYGCGADTFKKVMNDIYPSMHVFSYDPFFKKDHNFLEHLITFDFFDIVTFWDSFEHIRRLEIVPLLKGKYIFMTIPIIDNIKSIYKWKHYVPGEHVWYFSTSVLVKLFEKWNYKLITQSDFEEKLRSKGLKSFCFKHMED